MSDCIYKVISTDIDGINALICQRCGNKTQSKYPPRLVHTYCVNTSPPTLQISYVEEGNQIGSILHELLCQRLGVGFRDGCDCKEQLMQMNEWGPKGCRKNLNKIVAGLLAEAKRREWKMEGRPILSRIAKIGTELPGGIIFARAWARKLVLEAIERSEQND